MRYGDGTQYRLAQFRRLVLLVGLFLLRVFDMYAVGFGDGFDGLLEVHALLFLVEFDAVAPTVAAVAVPQFFAGRYGERGSVLGVKGARGEHRGATSAEAQPPRLQHVLDVKTFYSLYRLVAYHISFALSQQSIIDWPVYFSLRGLLLQGEISPMRRSLRRVLWQMPSSAQVLLTENTPSGSHLGRDSIMVTYWLRQVLQQRCALLPRSLLSVLRVRVCDRPCTSS